MSVVLKKQSELFLSRLFAYYAKDPKNSYFDGSFFIEGRRGKYTAHVDFGRNYREKGIFGYYIEGDFSYIYMNLDHIEFKTLQFEGQYLDPLKFRFAGKKKGETKVVFFKIGNDMRGWVVTPLPNATEEAESLTNFLYISNIIRNHLITSDVIKYR